MECIMDHIVLNVDDVDGMVAFYIQVLGLTTDRLDDYLAARVPFPSVRLNANTVIDLFPKRLWQRHDSAGPGRVNLNHFCMALSKTEWDALDKRLQANGVTLDEGPVPRWGARGTGTSIYFSDPEGNRIEA
jgi:catechol 2,3-dioxygenase-like lactoylglutathione lyase family enzyme